MDARNYIWSDSLGEMVIKGFKYRREHYTWNDSDCVYYADDSDESWFSDVPEGAIAG